MKHRLLLFMVVILVLSMPGRASAAYKWFVPDHGQVRVWSTGFSLQSLDWDADALSFRWWDAVEFEIRANQAGKTIGDFFSGLGSTWSGNLPGKYREYDQDDVTLGCWSPHLIDHYSTYQAMTYMIPHPDLPTNFAAFLECELGYDGGMPVDPYPIDDDPIINLTLPMSSFSSW